jgi:hypothetical protein
MIWHAQTINHFTNFLQFQSARTLVRQNKTKIPFRRMLWELTSDLINEITEHWPLSTGHWAFPFHQQSNKQICAIHVKIMQNWLAWSALSDHRLTRRHHHRGLECFIGQMIEMKRWLWEFSAFPSAAISNAENFHSEKSPKCLELRFNGIQAS